jgi:hypothetical protein
MAFGGEEGITLAFIVFYYQLNIYHAANMYFKSCINGNKCHIINLLFTSVCTYNEGLGSIFLCTGLG